MTEDTPNNNGAESRAEVAPNPVSTEAEQQTPIKVQASLKTGAEEGVAKFCDEAFVNPEAAQRGAEALIQAFDNNFLWLATLVQPWHLVAELRQSSARLTHIIVAQWQRQDEFRKLYGLGSALLDSRPPLKTHEAGQIMALLASCLGILRPECAQNLLETCRPLLQDSSDQDLLKEANEWVAIGRVLESLTFEDRVFWNLRLREPGEDWDWEAAATRATLRRLVPLVKWRMLEELPRIRHTVPGCWWDAIHEPIAAKELPMRSWGLNDPRVRVAATFAAGILVGVIGITASISTWKVAPGESPGIAAVISTGSASAVSQTPLFPQPSRAPGTPQLPQGPIVPQAAARLAAVQQLAHDFTNLQRLHNVVKTGSVRENELLLYGRGSMAPAGSPHYRALIRWLMLDPPLDAEVRRAVAKIATRALAPDDLLDTLRLCIYPGSPNEMEARDCANWTLELGTSSLTDTQKRELAAFPKMTVKS